MAAGACPLGPSPRADHVAAWLAAGRHGTMSWLAESMADRLDPRGRFPWAGSALALAAPYEPPEGPPAPGAEGPLGERIAAYARGRDYHKVLDRRSRALGKQLAAEFAGLRWRAYVDTGPLLERELAAAAGLGWIGKHGLLIDPQRGSYLLLAVILLSAELPAPEPVADGCAGCRACIDACPTDAIITDRVLDARRCISYRTIEHRGAQDEALDHAGYLFGCDLCQLACPYNHTPPAGHPELAPRASLDELTVADVAELDEATYQRVFEASAIKRATRAGLQRNARSLLDAPAPGG